MIKKYSVANHVIELDIDVDPLLEEMMSEYVADDSDVCDISIKCLRTSDDIAVKKENIVKLSDISFFYCEEDRDVLFYYDSKIDRVIAKLEFSKDYKDINAMFYNLKENYGVEDERLVFNVIGTAMSYVCHMNGGFVFHSSSICYDGCGIAFSAKSGTGKSTHTKLWLQNFPGTFILNDDTPIITQCKDGNFYLCGTPWAGTTGINCNVSVPLKAIVFLERADENSICTMSPSEAMAPFFEGIRSPLTDAMFSSVLDTLNKLLTQVPVYRLKCNMDSQAAIVAKEGIFSDICD